MADDKPKHTIESDFSWSEFSEINWALRDSFRLALKKRTPKVYKKTAELLSLVGTTKPAGFEDASSYALLDELETQETNLLRYRAEQLWVRGDGKNVFQSLLHLQTVVEEINEQLLREDDNLPYK